MKSPRPSNENANRRHRRPGTRQRERHGSILPEWSDATGPSSASLVTACDGLSSALRTAIFALCRVADDSYVLRDRLGDHQLHFTVIMRRALILAMLTICPDQGWGQHMAGIGLSSCGSWTRVRREPDLPIALMETQWVVGYLSGQANLFRGVEGGFDPLNNTDGAGVWAWIDNYCQANPLKQVWEAADAFSSAHPH